MDAGEWTEKDKIAHAGVGLVAGFAAHEAVEYLWPELSPLEQKLVAMVPVILLAVGKEVLDHQDPENHTSDAKDAVATAVGGAIGITLSWSF